MTDSNDIFGKNPDIASAATAATPVFRVIDQARPYVDPTEDSISLINFQVYIWNKCVELFNEIEAGPPELRAEKAFLLIDILALSLCTLAGSNHEGENEHTPSLKKFYSGGIKSTNDDFWNIKANYTGSFQNLYANFEELHKDYTNLVKHFSISKFDLLRQITLERLRQHFRTTARIWHWVLSNKPNGSKQAKEFELYLGLSETACREQNVKDLDPLKTKEPD